MESNSASLAKINLSEVRALIDGPSIFPARNAVRDLMEAAQIQGYTRSREDLRARMDEIETAIRKLIQPQAKGPARMIPVPSKPTMIPSLNKITLSEIPGLIKTIHNLPEPGRSLMRDLADLESRIGDIMIGAEEIRNQINRAYSADEIKIAGSK